MFRSMQRGRRKPPWCSFRDGVSASHSSELRRGESPWLWRGRLLASNHSVEQQRARWRPSPYPQRDRRSTGIAWMSTSASPLLCGRRRAVRRSAVCSPQREAGRRASRRLWQPVSTVPTGATTEGKRFRSPTETRRPSPRKSARHGGAIRIVAPAAKSGDRVSRPRS